MTEVREQASATGGRTLEIFANTPQLNEWIFSKLAGPVRGEVLEIGSGVGNISRLIRPRVDRLVVSDTEPHYLEDLERTFAGDPGVSVVSYDLDHAPPPGIAARRFDAIVAVNVIEHIADDRGLVARLAGLLRPGGNLLIYVPSCPSVFGTLDVALGHHRRYTPATLTSLLRSAELDPGEPRYVNLLGLAGWFVAGRILRRKLLSPLGVAVFERIVPVVRLEDKLKLPVGMGLVTHATKV
ncbi:MAG TPA: class I SAM-dependent methyltransferase [Polyangia bacterium]|nr:class I SAM-dependent methyltransferase [Polyangia bacterium]